MIVLLVSLSILILIIYQTIKYYSNRLKVLSAISSIPCKPPLPLLGNALDLLPLSNVLPALMRYFKDYGDIFKLEIGPEIYLHIANPDWAKAVLSSNEEIKKADLYKFFKEWLGNGLLLSKGDEWRRSRKVITPTFHFKILEQFIETYEDCGKILIENLKKKVGQPKTNIYELVTLYTLDVICETAMGTSINAQINNKSDYVRSVKEITEIITIRSVSPVYQYDWIYNLSSYRRTEKKCLKIMHGTINKIIKERKELLAKNGSISNMDDNLMGKRKMAFLDMLIKYNLENPDFNDTNIQDEVNTFMFEGHDTTSSAISFILYNLGQNPDIQEKVFNEVSAIYAGDKNKTLTYNDLKNLNYLEMVIKESLRLYPSVPVYLRRLENDAVYENFCVPKEVQIMVNAFVLHRNPNIFEDPEKFIPERFTPENQNKLSLYSYIPFSAGPRNCVGQKFAMLELKSAIAKIVYNFKISKVPDFEPILSIEAILRSINGIYVKLDNRL